MHEVMVPPALPEKILAHPKRTAKNRKESETNNQIQNQTKVMYIFMNKKESFNSLSIRCNHCLFSEFNY